MNIIKSAPNVTITLGTPTVENDEFVINLAGDIKMSMQTLQKLIKEGKLTVPGQTVIRGDCL